VSAVADPLSDHDQLAAALRLVEREAEEYLAAVDEAIVRPPGGADVDGTLPVDGDGTLPALTDLITAARDDATRSTGPRFFHFVMGGVTPAALGADWRVYFGTTVYDGKVAFRQAIVNWRTTESDVDLIVSLVRELGSRLLTTAPGR